ADLAFAQGFLSPQKSADNKEEENVESPRFMFRRFLEVLNAGDVDRAFPFVELPARMGLEQRRQTIRELFEVLNKRGSIDVALISNTPTGSASDLADMAMEDIGSIAMPGQNTRVTLRLVTDRGKRVWKFSADFMEKIPELAQMLSKTDFENKLPQRLTGHELFGIKLWQWIGLGLAVVVSVFSSLILSAILFFTMKFIVRRLQIVVPDEIFTNFITPLRLFIGLLVFSLAIPFLDTDLEFRQRLAYIEAIVLTISFCLFALRLITASVELIRLSYERQGKLNANAMLGPFKKGMSILIVVLGIISLMRNLGFDVTAIIAGLGIGGVAIALAGQKTIENLFGGISIIMDQPVRVGDFGKFGDVRGTVEDIGLRSTKVRTLDRTLVSIPNAEFSHMTLENFEKRDKFRWNATLGIRMDASTDQIRLLLMLIKELMLAHPMVYKDPARVRFISFGPSSLNLEIFAYIKASDHNEFVTVLEDLNLRVLDIIRDVGTDLAYPASTIYMERGKSVDVEKLKEVEKRIQEIKGFEGFPQPYYPSAWADQKIDTLVFPEKTSVKE
ncbi:MAG: mechanosensitive ion channel family protein, partial [Proteobacteria bacterium]